MPVRALLFALLLALLFGPGLVEQVRRSADPYRFSDDAQQHYGPFVCALRSTNVDACRNDYVFAYLAGRLPVGVQLLYRAGDPRSTGVLLPFVLYALTLAALSATAFALAGEVAAWGALAVGLADPAYLTHLAGALPRSFGFPLVALAALGLARGSWKLVGAAGLLAAALYLPVAILLATCLGLWLLVERSLPLGRRVALIVALAGVMSALAFPVLGALAPYGPLVGPADIVAFPEAGPHGRMADGDRTTDPVAATPHAWAGAFLVDLGGVSTYWLQAAVVAALLLLALRKPAARRLLALPAAMLACHAAATLLLPALYVPGRYAVYAVPVITAVALPAGFAHLASRVTGPRWARRGAALAVLAASLWVGSAIAKGDDGHGGLTAAIGEADRGLHAYLATLPEDALLAGWPVGPIEAVPYTTGRRVLVSREVHNPFHRAYLLELRARTEALIDAYFAVDAGPLEALARNFGVTHLLVDLDHYRATPVYFAPFDARIEAASARPGAGAALRSRADRALWRDDHRLLLALPREPGAEP